MKVWLGLLLGLIWTGDLWAQERITDFDVDIRVERSGDMVITETITIIAEGDQIRRGIFRELPARYTFMGVSQAYDYDLIGVTRDGVADQVTTLREGNAITWRIGQADVFLDPGQYEYRLDYRVRNQLRRHEGEDARDEVYWNATGTYWNFPIEKAQATIRFPDAARIVDTSVYTGTRRNAASNASIETNGSTVIFKTTQPLPRKAGLTISASIAPGVIAPMSDARRRELFWIRYGAAILLSIGGLGLLFYYWQTWNRIGRDPAKRPVFARYEPPAKRGQAYSPAAVHYLHHKGFKGMDALSSLMMQLGFQKVLDIEADKKRTVIRRLKTRAPHPDGQTLLDAILKGRGDRLVLDGGTDQDFYKGVTDFHRQLSQTYGPAYYKRNLGWALLGVIGSVALIVLVALSPVALNTPLAMGLLAALVVMNLLFAFLLPAPTSRGADVFAEIEGFKLYLETAEEKRLNMADPLGQRPPAMTVELYERFLPYAMALGVEKPWTKQFETSLPREAKAYQPTYAHGSALRSGRSPVDFSRSLGKTLTAGVAAAAPVSQSSGSGFSSGSGGGGFSGGGGGGGGGGGW
jgi:uncharacterized membrane protein YgcG